MFMRSIICNRINGKLREKRLTQKDLANKLGVKSQTVYNKITGKTEFTLTELLIIREYLEMEFNI